MKYVVLSGSPLDGMIVNGPFNSAQEAADWADGLTDDWWVGELEPVEDAPTSDFYANWNPERTKKMHLALGRAKDDLGMANTKIRSLEVALNDATKDLGRAMTENERLTRRYLDAKVQIDSLQIKVMDAGKAKDDLGAVVALNVELHLTNQMLVAEVAHVRRALDQISTEIHTTIGTCHYLSESKEKALMDDLWEKYKAWGKVTGPMDPE